VFEVESKKEVGRKTEVSVVFEMAGYTLNLFKELIKVLEVFDDNIPLTIGHDRLEIRMLDGSRIMMADITFPKYVFEEWLATVKTPIRVSIPLNDVKYAIEDVSKEARVKFSINLTLKTKKKAYKVTKQEPDKCPKCGESTTWNRLPAEKRRLRVYKRHVKYWYKCGCGWKGKIKQRKVREVHYTNEMVEATFKIIVKEKTTDEYNIKYVDVVSDDVPAPKIRFYAKHKLLAKEFLAKLKKLSRRADAVKLIGTEEKLTLQSVTDTGSVKVEIAKGVDMLLDSEVIKIGQVAIFSLDNLLTLLPRKSADLITVEYSNDMPIRITWHTQTEANIRFYLAPRIE
jgi:hypothetical protein